MGSVYRETYTKPIPSGAEVVTVKGEQFAKVKPAKGKAKLLSIVVGRNGEQRIVLTSATYVAKYRDGTGVIRKVSTGCHDEDAARSVLSKLERQSELVKSELISAAEASTADHQKSSLSEHFATYCDYLRARNASPVRIKNMQSQFDRVSSDCGFKRLSDCSSDQLIRWLNRRTTEGMSAATRNGYRETLVMFCNWCVQHHRLTSNPFSSLPKADARCDPRRKRRSMTEAELVKLLAVARLRPLAEFGRESVPMDANKFAAIGERRKRSNWTKAALTLDGLQSAVERARKTLAKNPALIADLERCGRERALIYKTLVLTGLRKGELASLTVGQLELDGAMPFVVLNAADEKNRQGSTIPIRADLANDLKLWLSDTPNPPTLRLSDATGAVDNKRPLFTVPAGLVRILDRDLNAAGIMKRDERGRTLDVHALRHSFGTLLSKGGVAPRTAQAAMRHSSVDLTMNVYTDPKLLDVHGALGSLPSLELNSAPLSQQNAMRATGTDDQDAKPEKRRPVTSLVPQLVPNTGKVGQSVSPAVHASTDGDEQQQGGANEGHPMILSKKASPPVFAGKAFEIGMTGFEPAASTSRSKFLQPSEQHENPIFVESIAYRPHCNCSHRLS